MSRLLVSQNTPDKDGRVVNITPESAGWRYVGFEVFHLKAGQIVSRDAGDREQCIVVVDEWQWLDAGLAVDLALGPS